MERESELVKVTGGMWLCALLGMEGGLGHRLGWVGNGCGAAPRSSSAFPGNIPAPWPCQELAERSRCCWWSISRPTGWNGFTFGIKSNDRALPLNHTQPGWRWKPLWFAAVKGSYKGEHK